ncbi:hypothetical protein AAMO2058_001740900, partial [Amorphochlora amoebiformis]
MAAGVLGVVFVAALAIFFSIHEVKEGHVGVYWQGGALLPSITDAGYHWKLPYTTFRNVFVKMQTDKVTDIPCGTSGGVVLYFEKIEVVNRLRRAHVYKTIKNYTVDYDKTWIYDKIHHEINQFCSTHTLQEVYIDKFDQLDEALVSSLQAGCNNNAPGIEIIAVRVTKPVIPNSIRSNYEEMEREKTKLMVAQQTQLVTLKEEETIAKREVIEALKQKRVSEINGRKLIAEKQTEQKMSEIENKVFLDTQKALADAELYTAQKEAEANKKIFSPQVYLILA